MFFLPSFLSLILHFNPHQYNGHRLTKVGAHVWGVNFAEEAKQLSARPHD